MDNDRVDGTQQKPEGPSPDGIQTVLPPLVRAPDFHPRRRLQIQGAIATASRIAAGDLAAATPRIAQMIKDTAAKKRPDRPTKKRRKDRKRQRQARRKNR